MASLAERDTSSHITELEIPCIHEVFSIPDIPQIRKEIEVPNNALSIIPKELLQRSEHIKNSNGLNLINTRLWINELTKKYDKPITIGSVPEEEWKNLFDKYDSFWFMGIYKPSPASREHCKKYPKSVAYAKPDVDPEKDIVASPFAIPEYTPNPHIAKDWQEWDKVVDYLHQNGKKVFLDFVPNHVALDHPWTIDHPDYFIQGTDEQKRINDEEQLKKPVEERCPLYGDVIDKNGKIHHLAHGKDLYFNPWSDVYQVDYTNPEVQRLMIEILLSLVDHGDGVRCDMAGIIDKKFIDTWGDRYFGGHLTGDQINFLKGNPFWPKAIAEVKAKAKELGRDDFTFIAEVYDDQRDIDSLIGHFDHLYRKQLYDDFVKVKNGEISYDALRKNIEYIFECNEKGITFVNFTENHDEPRSLDVFKEATESVDVITAFLPGVFLVCQGQTEGLKIRIPMQLDQPLIDVEDPEIKSFWDRILKFRGSRLFQESKLSLLKPDSQIDSRIFIQKCALGEYSLYSCTNLSNYTASGFIKEITKTDIVQASILNDDKKIEKIDQERENGFYIEIEKNKTQLLLVKHPASIVN